MWLSIMLVKYGTEYGTLKIFRQQSKCWHRTTAENLRHNKKELISTMNLL